MGMFVREVLLDSASLGSPGVDEIRWTAPVRPGDTLTGRSTVTDVQPSSTNPRRGTVFTTNEVFNQDGVLVMTLQSARVLRPPPLALAPVASEHTAETREVPLRGVDSYRAQDAQPVLVRDLRDAASS